MCVLAFLMTESLAAATNRTSTVSVDLDDCLRQDLPLDFDEWNYEAYRQHGCIVINWNVLSQTVSICFNYGLNFRILSLNMKWIKLDDNKRMHCDL